MDGKYVFLLMYNVILNLLITIMTSKPNRDKNL